MSAGFSWALLTLKGGGRVTRTGWNGKGQFLELQNPDENSKMTLPYIYITTVHGDRVPWVASQTDLLARDWEDCDLVKQPKITHLTDEHKDSVWSIVDGPPEYRVYWSPTVNSWMETWDGTNWRRPHKGFYASGGFVKVTP